MSAAAGRKSAYWQALERAAGAQGRVQGAALAQPRPRVTFEREDDIWIPPPSFDPSEISPARATGLPLPTQTGTAQHSAQISAPVPPTMPAAPLAARPQINPIAAADAATPFATLPQERQAPPVSARPLIPPAAAAGPPAVPPLWPEPPLQTGLIPSDAARISAPLEAQHDSRPEARTGHPPTPAPASPDPMPPPLAAKPALLIAKPAPPAPLPPPAVAPQPQALSPAPPPVLIEIGRIDIHLSAPPAPSARPLGGKAATPFAAPNGAGTGISLADYLAPSERPRR